MTRAQHITCPTDGNEACPQLSMLLPSLRATLARMQTSPTLKTLGAPAVMQPKRSGSQQTQAIAGGWRPRPAAGGPTPLTRPTPPGRRSTTRSRPPAGRPLSTFFSPAGPESSSDPTRRLFASAGVAVSDRHGLPGAGGLARHWAASAWRGAVKSRVRGQVARARRCAPKIAGGPDGRRQEARPFGRDFCPFGPAGARRRRPAGIYVRKVYLRSRRTITNRRACTCIM